jgi:hypothetical protein
LVIFVSDGGSRKVEGCAVTGGEEVDGNVRDGAGGDEVDEVDSEPVEAADATRGFSLRG